ncbi:MAG: hypothetical protein H6549_09770 [Chitinophagales bacterium]|nr:hypothetical protein [Chitinophagales bacterium]
MKKGIIFLSIIINFFGIQMVLVAQEPGNAFQQMASLPLQSPQASSLSKYIESPVNYYNGKAGISVPIYSINFGDIEIPITLSYQADGIKVNQEASWVGLGWNLDIGGLISHDIKGDDDEYGSNHVFNQVFPTGSGIGYNPTSMVVGKKCNTGDIYNINGTPYNCSNLFSLVGGAPVDGEPDLYVYNFGRYSGKFFSGVGSYVDMGTNNIIFQKTGPGFTAKTPDGYQYKFDVVEKAWSFPVENGTNTAYYLSKIISPTGKVVSFQYKSFKEMIDYQDAINQSWRNQFPSEINSTYTWGNDNTVLQLPMLSEHYTSIEYLGGYAFGELEVVGLHQGYSSTTSSNYFLDKIVFENGHIDFVKSPRNDLYGVKLDAIEIYDENENLLRSIPFEYDYFVSDKQDDDMYDRINKVTHLETYDPRVDHYPTSFRYKRLKLLRVEMEHQRPYIFQYLDNNTYEKLPYKTSFARDFWGYYNGRNNPSLIPDFDLYNQQMSLPSQLSNWDGANREVNLSYIKAGMLSTMFYPTGGQTDFYFESNTFENLSPQQQTSYTLASYGGVDAGSGIQKYYFDITENTYCDIWGGLYCNGMMDMNSPSYDCGCLSCSGDQVNTLYANITKVDPVTHQLIAVYPSWDFQISNQTILNAGGIINMPNQFFTPGTYCITVNYPDNHNPPGNIPNNRRAELYVKFYEPSGQNAVGLGGGLRISSIKHYDPYAKQTIQRKFSYSGGKMMRYPKFYSNAYMKHLQHAPVGGPIYNEGYYMHYYLYSTPAYPYSFSANGSFVGYDLVTETLGDPFPNGKTEFSFQNTADIVSAAPGTYLPGVPSTAYNDNGFLKKVSYYNNANSLLRETINEKGFGLTNTYWAFKGKYQHNTANIGLDNYLFTQNYGFSFYPIQVGKLLTTRTTDKEYSNGQVITIVKDYVYNNKGYLKQSKLTTSNGDMVTSDLAYPSDYTGVSSGWIQDLKDKNYIASPLEKLNKRNGLVTGGTFTLFNIDGDIVTAKDIYNIELTTPESISSSSPTGTLPNQFKPAGSLKYSKRGNLIESRKDNDLYISYLWGHKGQYPIAKVVGASFTTINSIVDTSLLNIGTETQREAELSDLRASFENNPLVQVSTYTYIPMVGMISETDPNKRTIYYEYDYANRLVLIRDFQNRIIKKICYNNEGQPGNCGSPVIYYNQEANDVFTKNNCGVCEVGSQVTYTVPEGTYSSTIDQADANQQAQIDITNNGQAYANTNGTCTPASGITITYENYALQTGFTATYTDYYNSTISYSFNVPSSGTGTLGCIPAGKYNLVISRPPPGGFQYELLFSDGCSYVSGTNYAAMVTQVSVFGFCKKVKIEAGY